MVYPPPAQNSSKHIIPATTHASATFGLVLRGNDPGCIVHKQAQDKFSVLFINSVQRADGIQRFAAGNVGVPLCSTNGRVSQ